MLKGFMTYILEPPSRLLLAWVGDKGSYAKTLPKSARQF